MSLTSRVNQFHRDRQRRPTSMIISEPTKAPEGWRGEGDERLSFMTTTMTGDNDCGDDGNKRFPFRVGSARPEGTSGLSRTCHYGWLRNNGQPFSPTRTGGKQWLFTLLTIYFSTWLLSFASSAVKPRPLFHIGLASVAPGDKKRARDNNARGYTVGCYFRGEAG